MTEAAIDPSNINTAAPAPSPGAAPAPAPATPAAPGSSTVPVFFGLTLGQAFLALGWPVLLLVGVFTFHLDSRLKAIEAGVRSRPAVKVVNVAETMRGLIRSGLTSDQAIVKADQEFQRYADAGYIVLDNNAVMAAPKGAKLP